MPGTRKTAVILVTIAICGFLFLVGFYVINPFATASDDPRARIFGFMPYRMPSSSMHPTLKAGDFVVVNTAFYMRDEPANGDIIVFNYPEDISIDYVKRIVGVAGDRVIVENGKLTRNGVSVEEPYIYLQENIQSYAPRVDITVPAGKYFVLGDNRHNSRDSRYWGFVSREHLVGKVVNSF